MAEGCRLTSGADLAVATTGNAGPEPSEGKPVGLVYVAVASAWHSEVVSLQLDRRDDDLRSYIRELASSHALFLALKTVRLRPQDNETRSRLEQQSTTTPAKRM